jgi:predicted SAM-dependent methyltransferase
MAPLRLNIGAGDVPIDGYTPIDIRHGQAAYPLPYETGSVEAIYASHVLEHYGIAEAPRVLAEWVRVLRPGGELKIAVPDFARAARAYQEGDPLAMYYVIGGQQDEHDHHRSVYDLRTLSDLMRRAGLVGISRWTSTAKDCAALPVSLNLRGVKVADCLRDQAKAKRVAAVMSMPRLAFTANFRAVHSALAAAGVGLTITQGVFWGQCLERAITEILDRDRPDYVLTIDYDSVFTLDHVYHLLTLIETTPGCDALAALQVQRGTHAAMAWRRDGLRADEFAADVVYVDDAHFGLTLLRAARLADLPHPWFCAAPAPNGTWFDGRLDEDIYFWRKWRRAGNTVGIASRVAIGHMEPMIVWPSDTEPRGVCVQTCADYDAMGVPDSARR